MQMREGYYLSCSPKWRIFAFYPLLLIGLFLGSSANADSLLLNPLGPINLVPDENNVNLTTGAVTPPVAMAVIIGDSASGLTYKRQLSWGGIYQPSFGIFLGAFGWSDNYNYQIAFNVPNYLTGDYVDSVTSGSTSEEFDPQTLAPKIPNGSKLEVVPIGQNHNELRYTDKSGKVIYFGYDYGPNGSVTQTYAANYILYPDGKKIYLNYSRKYTSTGDLYERRIQSVNDNLGNQLRFEYKSNDNRPYNINYNLADGWDVLVSVRGVNASVDYCRIDYNPCTGFTVAWPKASTNVTSTSSNTIWSITDPLGLTSTVSIGTHNYADKPYIISSVNGNIIYTYTFNPSSDTQATIDDRVASVSSSNLASTYSWTSLTGSIRTNALGGTQATTSNLRSQITYYKDELSRERRYVYDNNYLLHYEVRPEGLMSGSTPTSDYTQYDYDSRGNVVQATRVSKAVSGLPNIVASAGYDATCANFKTCNKPNWTRDANGNQSDFRYDPAHGGVLSEMKPAPAAGTVRPLTLTVYAQRNAWIKNSSGLLAQSPDPIWMVSTVTECQTYAFSSQPTCDSTAPQTVTSYGYGTSGTSEAMLVKAVAVSSGSMTLRTCYRYDVFRRRIGETKPNANLGVCP